jgi:anti-sigma B factor antagonist
VFAQELWRQTKVGLPRRAPGRWGIFLLPELKRAVQPKYEQGGLSVALTIASREVDGVTVLDLSGRITLGEGSVQLRDAIRDLISKGQKNILLNLGDVNYIDSSGLGELVSAYTTARNQSAALKLLSLTKKVHDLLQLTKLYTVFDIYDDEASAIASFK